MLQIKKILSLEMQYKRVGSSVVAHSEKVEALTETHSPPMTISEASH